MPQARTRQHGILLLLTLLLLTVSAGVLADGRALTFAELMQFRTLHDVAISDDGAWVAYTSRPDRGDGEAVLRATTGDTEYRIERGKDPVVAGNHAVALIEPSLEAKEKAKDKKGKEKPKTGLSVLDLGGGQEQRLECVKNFKLSDDGAWLAYQPFGEDDCERSDAGEEAEGEEAEEASEESEEAEEAAEAEEGEEAEGEEAEEAEEEEEEKEKEDEDAGMTLVLRRLFDGTEKTIEHVESYSFDEASTVLVYNVRTTTGEGNGVFVQRMGADADPETLVQDEKGRYTAMTWARDKTRLAFLGAPVDEDLKPLDATLYVWDGGEAQAVASREQAPEGFTLPSTNNLTWSRDGERLFFGFKPVDPNKEEKNDDENADDEEESFDPYDLESLVEDRDLAVWHWDDPLIQTHQEKQWKNEKNRTYGAVLHLDNNKIIALADFEARDLIVPQHGSRALVFDDTPYLKYRTWEGFFRDVYVADLQTGDRQQAAERLGGWARLSPDGGYATYFQNHHWHLYNASTGETRNLTEGMDVPFANEDHDYPSQVPGYGVADWLRDSSAVLIYDKYDVWQFPLAGGEPLRLTAGREEKRIFRLIDVEPDEEGVANGGSLLLSGYHDHEKYEGFYAGQVGKAGVRKLYEPGLYRLNFEAKAKDNDRIVFTRESYNEFPDLWTTDLSLEEPVKLSEANPQIADYAWGDVELVEWSNIDGVPMQGVLIKPGNYEPGKRYPVLVYFYRFFSQRAYQFNQPVVNHRPSFPLYASNGYAVFLPDVRFEIGRPGYSATKSLVPGVQKLVDMGIADPDAIGLHGHSWSGYQAAFVVTQTNIFKAVVSGAPVSNMTSAYSGIRWGTGLARQFQYEKTQSRLGGSLWEYPERYIENSPVFFADHIETPMLIQFGDIDEAVPWYQGIELYLACRRLEKNCIFLQYKGEPHHLKKYPNKVDYSIKMKEFFDHHLKGEPAPPWMTEGEPYQGED